MRLNDGRQQHEQSCLEGSRTGGREPDGESVSDGDLCHASTVVSFEMRSARPDDADAVASYHQRCFEQTFARQLDAGTFEAPDRHGTTEQLRSWFRSGSTFLSEVAAIEGQPIGHFTLHHHQLVHLFVSPPHQGTGLGARLLGRAESVLEAAGHCDIELHTRVENLRAIGFYTHAGWTMTDRLIRTVEHGIDYHEHVMTKSLI